MLTPDKSHGNQSYCQISDEYYSFKQHPTSSNFRSCSIEIIKFFFRYQEQPVRLLELGAGKSIIANVSATQARQGFNVLSDLSHLMLKHTDTSCFRDVFLCSVDANQIPFPDRQFNIVVASLCDPYNTPAMWASVSRVLKPSALFMLTQPSYEWARAFRKATNSPVDKAQFTNTNGENIFVDSFIKKESEILQLADANNLCLHDTAAMSLARLNSICKGKVSWKIKDYISAEEPVVEGYVFQKNNSFPEIWKFSS